MATCGVSPCGRVQTGAGMPDTLTIGDFARATHLSIKMLRHYHEIGLLEPAAVDPNTGYRHYRIGQIREALVVRRLRGLGVPLDEVRGVLYAPDVESRNAVLSAHLRRLEIALAETRTAAESLRELIAAPGASPSPDVAFLSLPPAPAAAITGIIAVEGGGSWVFGALAELRAALAAQHAVATGDPAGIFAEELFSEGRGEATVFVPISGTVRPAGRVLETVVPAVELATAVHVGAHDDIDRTYGALGAYVARHALSVPGPIREYYLTDLVGSPDTSTWRTQVGWPIFRTAP